ncbi:MAG: CpsD/CapB family tyrosine-protein kinase [Candidatus Binatia bacterium]
MSKIYEAVRKAAEERERFRVQNPAQAVAVPGRAAPEDPREEEYQKLRASLLSVPVPAGLHTILVTSARHGEGVTTVSLGLASALAKERESRVLLVEGNCRRPSFRAILPLTSGAGVADFAAGRAASEAVVTRLEELNFSVIPAGGLPEQGKNVETIDVLVGRLHPQFDFILIDAPPVNSYADASMLATKVDGVILVIEAEETPISEAEAAKRQLDKVGARILGVVLNRRRSYIPAFLESVF